MAADYGAPQKRERIFAVGCNSNHGENAFVYPEKTHGPGRRFDYVTVEDALRYLPKIHSANGEEICYNPTYGENYANKDISEAAYEYYKFMFGAEYSGNPNYKKCDYFSQSIKSQ